jgi:hypothetical protein
MKTPAKLGAYLAGLAVVFAAALGIGSAVGPVGPAGEGTVSPAQTGVDHGDMTMDGDAGT